MEGAPIPERIPLKEEILQRILAEGFNEEIRGEVIKWRMFRETLVQTSRDQIILNIDMFELYNAAGMPEDGFEDARETYAQALLEGAHDLVDRILSIYPELEEGLTII